MQTAPAIANAMNDGSPEGGKFRSLRTQQRAYAIEPAKSEVPAAKQLY